MNHRKRRRHKSTLTIILSFSLLALLIGVATSYSSSDTIITKVDPNHKLVTENKSNYQETLYDKIKNKEPIKVLIIGDSIGESDGATKEEDKWYERLTTSLYQDYSVKSQVDKLTTPGGTSFGGWVDFINKNPKDYDLTFICFGQNDQGYFNVEEYSNIYESIVTKVIENNPHGEIFTITESSMLQNTAYPDAIKKLSDYYGLTYIDTREPFKSSNIPYKKLTRDGVHPNSDGYALYSKQIYDTLIAHLKDGKKVKYKNQNALNQGSQTYKNATFITDFKDVKGFNYDKSMSMYTSNVAGDYVTTTFKGTVIGMTLLGGTDGGTVNAYIDGKLVKEFDSYVGFTIKRDVLITDELTDGEHTLKLEISNKKNNISTDTKVKVIRLITNGKQP